MAAIVVLTYITLGGLSAAIYNEVLQFFVIVAALLPLTLLGLHRVGGWDGLTDKITEGRRRRRRPAGRAAAQQLAGPGAVRLRLVDFWSVVGIVFGLGFVLSFGYWTTNFVEVQRAMASDSISSARKTPVIGVLPEDVRPVHHDPARHDRRGPGHRDRRPQGRRDASPGGASGDGVAYNDALLYLMRDLLPNGLLGLAITGLLAAFMAGMAANISAFNTVFSYDLWQDYVVKDREDGYYLRVGRIATVAATFIAILTATFASNFSNIMDYLQTLFGFFNAPLFATFILGMFWKRMTATAGWVGPGRRHPGRGRSSRSCSEDAFGSWSTGVIPIGGQGAAFLAASAAFIVDVVLSVAVSLVTKPKPAEELRGLVYSETPKEERTDPKEASYPWYRRTVPLACVSLAMVIVLNVIF